jgi:hypothetical protein
MTRRSLACAVLAGSLALAVATPAQATIYDHVRFAFDDSSEEAMCGLDVRIDTSVRGNIVLRTGKHELDQTFLGHGNTRHSDTFTNLANGESFTIEGQFRDGDVKGTPLGGDIFEFVLVHAGMERVVDGDGTVVLRDRGAVRTTYTFDTLGDSRPGGIVLEATDKFSGQHPLFELDDDAFCAMVNDLIG